VREVSGVENNKKYRVDRLKLISYKCQKKKNIKDMTCRYLAKSQIIKCNAQRKKLIFVNFRGSHFKKVSFDATTFWGDDFWGATFNGCSFKKAVISDCVFMACKFKNCDFTDAKFLYSTIVNTNLSHCKNIALESGVRIYKQYPKNDCNDDLLHALEVMKDNRELRKNKLLHLPGNRNNELNLYMLLKKFRKNELSNLLLELNKKSTKNITTYKKLELELKKVKDML